MPEAQTSTHARNPILLIEDAPALTPTVTQIPTRQRFARLQASPHPPAHVPRSRSG